MSGKQFHPEKFWFCDVSHRYTKGGARVHNTLGSCVLNLGEQIYVLIEQSPRQTYFASEILICGPKLKAKLERGSSQAGW